MDRLLVFQPVAIASCGQSSLMLTTDDNENCSTTMHLLSRNGRNRKATAHIRDRATGAVARPLTCTSFARLPHRVQSAVCPKTSAEMAFPRSSARPRTDPTRHLDLIYVHLRTNL